MQVSGPLKEDTVTVPKIAAVERREGAGALARAPGCLRKRCPSYDLRRSGAPPPSRGQQQGPGESPETGQSGLAIRGAFAARRRRRARTQPRRTGTMAALLRVRDQHRLVAIELREHALEVLHLRR